MEDKTLDVLSNGKEEAEAVIADSGKRESLLADVKNLAEENRNELQEYWGSLLNLFALLQDYFTGKYKEISVASVVLVVSSFLFIVSPVHILPKWVPLGGFMERTVVLIFILEYVKEDLQKYSDWKASESA